MGWIQFAVVPQTDHPWLVSLPVEYGLVALKKAAVRAISSQNKHKNSKKWRKGRHWALKIHILRQRFKQYNSSNQDVSDSPHVEVEKKHSSKIYTDTVFIAFSMITITLQCIWGYVVKLHGKINLVTKSLGHLLLVSSASMLMHCRTNTMYYAVCLLLQLLLSYLP